MRSYRDLRRASRALGGIPKTCLTLQDEQVSSAIFDMHKIAKQAANYQKEIRRLNKQLKDKTDGLKALKKQFEALKSRAQGAPSLFKVENGSERKPKSALSSHHALKEARAQKEIESLDKFFSVDLEY